jgi:hypothetical protein
VGLVVETCVPIECKDLAEKRVALTLEEFEGGFFLTMFVGVMVLGWQNWLTVLLL